ncbi:DUF4293 domain-containing protein [Pseudopedobacter beijingensis]|uniref:DUF4293 domain-containing protein n=1 Tax=Pseudopedobacter beijingensis TaxID=1207056 RepID=A0ABW4IHD5_9SPHI
MIQRIQSVYLLLASLALFALFIFPLANVLDASGAKRIRITGVYEIAENGLVQKESFLLLTIATVVLALIPLVLIFLYKNRKQQMLFVYLTAGLVIGYSYWLSTLLKSATVVSLQASDYGIGIGLSSVAVLFLILAARGIKRDDQLVRSADRLR